MQPKYSKLIGIAIGKYRKDKTFELVRLSPDFFFGKAVQALQHLSQTPLDAYAQIDFLERYAAFKGNYADFVKSLSVDKSDAFLHQLGENLGKMIAYLDKNAANKPAWNDYPDKHTLIAAHLRQDAWIKGLLQYLQNERNTDKIENPRVRFALRYLLSPRHCFPITSPLHRRQISEHILEKPYNEQLFEQDLLAYFHDFQIQIHHADNITHWITALLYTPEVCRLWRFDELENDYYQQQAEMDYFSAQVAEPETPYRTGFLPFPLNQIFYGVPGTGKTHYSRIQAIAIAEQQPIEWVSLQDAEWLHERWTHYQTLGQIAMLTFHQTTAYEDFIEGIKPKTIKGNICYEIEDGLLKRMAHRALEQPNEAFVLVIDEINRGNIAAIFGELITLLDADKRQGAINALQLWLPYSKQPFALPRNLYLVGTMNSNDRAVQALDTALRRRFHFRHFNPNPELLPQDMDGIDLQNLLSTINRRLVYLLGEEYQIGHAYFLPVNNMNDLQQVFQYQIIPLLLDFFYGDLGKVGCVLGQGFVEVIAPSPTPLAPFDYAGALPDEDSLHYRLRSFPVSKKAFLL